MKFSLSYLAIIFLVLAIAGCVGVLIVGGAAGALGAYAVGKDTVQMDTDRPYDSLWLAAESVSKARGTVRQNDPAHGYIQLEADKSLVWIRLTKLTRATTRVRVSARKYHFPNMELSQDIFVKIMEEAR